ncbi:TPA: hypothetical protein OMQ57_000074 [Acinetobacter baumannii]|nr:hypothetical protein [Acinetobacter baumannii]
MNKFIVILLLLLPFKSHAFTVYQYIFWQNYIDENGQLVKCTETEFQKYMQKIKLKKLRVVYQDHIFTKGKPDPDKIKEIALESQRYPMVPISLDIEIGNKHKPESMLPMVIESLDLYHKFGGKAEIGVYGVLPQNVHPDEKLGKVLKRNYGSLNKQYEELASKVDFISPVLYNNWVRDYAQWESHAKFQIDQSKIYAKKYNLKIIPYMTGTYLFRKDIGKINKTIDYLSADEMKRRIQFVKNQGVDGVLIWEGSANDYKLTDGKKPVFNQYSGPYSIITNLANQKGQ